MNLNLDALMNMLPFVVRRGIDEVALKVSTLSADESHSTPEYGDHSLTVISSQYEEKEIAIAKINIDRINAVFFINLSL
jgi:hypothetical protein